MRNDIAGMIALKQGAFNKLPKEERDSNNYLVINKNNLYFILNNYKTKGTYNELKLAQELIRFPTVKTEDKGIMKFLSKKLSSMDSFSGSVWLINKFNNLCILSFMRNHKPCRLNSLSFWVFNCVPTLMLPGP